MERRRETLSGEWNGEVGVGWGSDRGKGGGGGN